MASFASPFTQSQLEIAVGGAPNLVRLAKASNTADPQYAAFVVEVQSAALMELYSILQVAFDPNDPTVAGSIYAQQYGVTLGVYWAHHKGTGGIEIPEKVDAAHDKTLTAIKEARSGSTALGTTTDPTSNAGAKTVTVDATGSRIVRRNMGGFC